MTADLRCPRLTQVGRASLADADIVLGAHLRICADCRAEREAIVRLSERARALPTPVVGAAVVARTRGALLGSAHARSSRRGPRWVKVAVLGLATVATASVLAAAGGRVLRRASAPVVVPIVARPPVRPTARPALDRRPMDRADAGVPGPVALLSPPPARPSPAAHHPSAPARPLSSPAQAAFAEGWQALRAGDDEGAARALERAAALAGATAVGVDARYWRAVALLRGGRSAAGRSALADFLARHPGSPRAGQAAAMLGWLLAEAHQCAAAAVHFRRAEQDPAAAVRQSARAGLAELAHCQPVTPAP